MKATGSGVLEDLSLKFQNAWTKIEVAVSLPCWLSQFSLDTKLGETPNVVSQILVQGVQSVTL